MESKCCQIGLDGKACGKKADVVYKNKPMCKDCFINGARPEQDMNKMRKYQMMMDNANGLRINK